VSVPIEAASVLLARSPDSDEVYFVGRAPNLRFMGGMVAFPGGKVHADDARLARPADGLTSWHVCAARELFEEAGVLLARRADGTPVETHAAFDGWRRALLDESRSFADILAEGGLHLDAADLRPAGHLVTPAFAPMRFDTAFFVAHLPPNQEPSIWPGELTHGFWGTSASALQQWRQGLLLLTPPTVTLLQVIEGRAVRELPEHLTPLLERLDRGEMPPIWFCPGVLMVPLDCQGLPPTTHTNTLIVGTGPTYLIDPGPVDPVEQETLFAVLAGRRIDAILLSHHHPDHVGAALACARRFGAPIRAHARTAQLLAGHVPVDGLIGDGEVFDLGVSPHGRGRWAMLAVFTPGHAPGHLAFYIPDYQLLLAGDMVSTLSSMIISPDDGDLAEYVRSLELLKRYPCRLLMPAHGGPTTRPAAVLGEAVAHRALREAQLLESLDDRPRSLDDLASEMYRGFPPATVKLGRMQLHAGLIKLERERRVVALGADRWQRVGGG
jgi:ribonuclease/clavin/mitogillin